MLAAGTDCLMSRWIGGLVHLAFGTLTPQCRVEVPSYRHPGRVSSHKLRLGRGAPSSASSSIMHKTEELAVCEWIAGLKCDLIPGRVVRATRQCRG